ncbi:MAG: hypothetical protein LBI06_01760 [Treponema sp.]|jgi:endogenous inhibitor of DNA gyrase (YacG/DUF329 family)|nr:hypothetical protein [Treponema sp.]
MQDFLQMLIFVIIAVALIWFGFTLFAGRFSKLYSDHKFHAWLRDKPEKGTHPNETCPICSSRLNRGDLVKTLAFPSITGGKDRLMHIKGCAYCIDGYLERKCPVCGTELDITDVLVARIFERPGRKAHVHIAGCNKCRRSGKL